MNLNSTTSPNRYTWWCVILLFIFAVSKIPALGIPFFWDELGVYGASGLYMHDNTLSMLPAALPPDLSRGHPLLFTCIHAIGFHIFGDSVTGGHITGLLITISLLASIFYFLRTHFSPHAALIGLMLVMVQPVFFAQSVLILPEVLLTLWILWALHFWAMHVYAGFALFASLAILTKETAIILPVVILCAEITFYAGGRRTITQAIWKPIVSVCMPLVVFGIFLLVQHAQHGWYFFPYHGDNVKLHLPRILSFSGDYLTFIFWEQGRMVMSLAAAVCIFMLIRQRKIRIDRFSVLIIFLCIGGVAFNALSFYMNRYVLFVVVGWVMLFSIVLSMLQQSQKKWLLLLPVISMANAMFIYGDPFEHPAPEKSLESQFSYDENMQYADYVRYMDTAIDHVLSGPVKTPTVFANFPVNVAMRDTRFGFTDKQIRKDFTLVGQPSALPPDVFIIANPGSYGHVLPENGLIEVTEVIGFEHAVFTIYRPVSGKQD